MVWTKGNVSSVWHNKLGLGIGTCGDQSIDGINLVCSICLATHDVAWSLVVRHVLGCVQDQEDESD